MKRIKVVLTALLVVAAISVVTWHYSRPAKNTCPWCAARVYHTHDEPIETERN